MHALAMLALASQAMGQAASPCTTVMPPTTTPCATTTPCPTTTLLATTTTPCPTTTLLPTTTTPCPTTTPSTCCAFTCEVGWAPKAACSTLLCPAGGCTNAQCCLAPTTTPCPTTTLAPTTTTPCPTTTPSTCCAFTCEIGWAAQANCSTKICPAGGC